jgi:hypothetical protein
MPFHSVGRKLLEATLDFIARGDSVAASHLHVRVSIEFLGFLAAVARREKEGRD